jgi:subtilisin family serine protease
VAARSSPPAGAYYRVEAPDETLDELARTLSKHELVESAYVKPPAEPARLNEMIAIAAEPAATPDFSVRQGYLDAAPAGVDARFAWTLQGGRGSDVRIIDIEGAWRFDHEDLISNQGGVVAGTPSSDLGWRNHGTAVVGEIGGDLNSIGIVGICPEANQQAVSIFGGLGSATAIREAADRLRPGDILLIELHRPGPRFNFQSRDDQRGYIAVEWWPDDLSAIQYATGRGVIVVEAAGNGAESLDDVLYDQRPVGFPSTWQNPFRRNPVDSGAIVVGAGAPPPGTHGRDHGPDRSRLGFSNFGDLVDAQGWGREVTTTGYGDLQGGSDENNWYTDQFSGTSSASPIVVGALGCVQGVLRGQGRPALTPQQARDLLRSTGSPQLDAPGRPATQRIGNRPDLRQMIRLQTDPVQRRPRLRLLSLECFSTEDWTGPDEAYLTVNGERIWGPSTVSPGELRTLSSVPPIRFRRRARIDLYDQDAGWPDEDDHLGAHYVWASQAEHGEQQQIFNGDGARYRLSYEVVI